MKQGQHKDHAQYKLSRSMSGLIEGIQRLALAEVILFREEIKASTLDTVKHLFLLTLSLWIASLGLLPLLGYLVITLGSSLNERYGLSCLIIGLAIMSLGATFAHYFIRKLSLIGLQSPLKRKPQQSKVLIFQKKLKKEAEPFTQEEPQEKRAAS